MKTPKTILTFILLFVLFGTAFTQGVAINTVGADPDDSAMLDVSATNKGVLIPRLTDVQRYAIDVASNPESLLIFNTDRKCFEFYSDGSWHGIDCPFVCGLSNITFTYKSIKVTYGTVEKDYGGGDVKCWMDRNLGASQVATSSTDTESYGDYFQWGRLDDWHQAPFTSSTVSVLSNSDDPGHSNFILSASSPYDWLSTQNNNLWQGENGTNNPCPSGWRIPTEADWSAERNSWNSDDATGAFASILKLPMPGARRYTTGASLNVGLIALYWSSTVSGTRVRVLAFGSNANVIDYYRAYGLPVRCIKD